MDEESVAWATVSLLLTIALIVSGLVIVQLYGGG
jgi:hypothetical protein